ncbi:MAG: FAD-dependent oxidoreductase [Steroidobacteraceae bacterium]
MVLDADVVIVGGGPAGMATALFLIDHGIDVLLLERGEHPHSDPRAATYHPPTLEMLEKSGVTAELHQRGLIARYWQLRDRRAGLIAEFDLAVLAEDTPYPYRLQCEQHKLVEMMQRRVMQSAHARVLHGVDVEAILQDDSGVIVRGKNASETCEIRSRWLVGADGGRSIVRKSQEIDFEGFTWAERFLVITTDFDFAAEGYAFSSYTMDPVEWVATFKIPGDRPQGLWRCVFPTRPEEEESDLLSHARATERLAALSPQTRFSQVVHTNLYAVHQRVAKTYRRDRVLLVGDAAHVNNPLGGMGLNFGLHDTYELAPRLAAVVRGESDDSTLDVYDRRRRSVAESVLQTQTIANKKLLEEKDPLIRAERQQDLRDTAVDPVRARAYLLRTSMIEGLRAAANIR